MLTNTARNKLHCAESWHKNCSNLSLSPCDPSPGLGQTSISMKLNSVSFQSLSNKFLCKSQILQSGKGVRKYVYHGSEKCECITFCTYFFFFFLTEIISNFSCNVTGMIQIECQGWNEHFFTSDVVKWKHFPHYCPFVRGIHGPLVNLRKGPVLWIFYILWTSCCTNSRMASDLRHYDAYVTSL